MKAQLSRQAMILVSVVTLGGVGCESERDAQPSSAMNDGGLSAAVTPEPPLEAPRQEPAGAGREGPRPSQAGEGEGG